MMKTIPEERFIGLDVHEGDTLHIVAMKDATFLIEISRTDAASKAAPGKAGAWLRSARGSVRQAADRFANDLRMDYYAAKHGLNS